MQSFPWSHILVKIHTMEPTKHTEIKKTVKCIYLTQYMHLTVVSLDITVQFKKMIDLLSNITYNSH